MNWQNEPNFPSMFQMVDLEALITDGPASARRSGAPAHGAYLTNMQSSARAARTRPGEKPMTDPTTAELDERIALIRRNISDLVEQAAAYSGAGDEGRTADRIAQQEEELRRLIAQRDALQKSQRR
jgi:hypothetical protein